MLAASYLSSNVPPDDLQAAPVPSLLAIRSNELREHVPGARFQAQPTHRSQQDTAGNKLRRMPFEIGPENSYLAIGCKLQRNTSGPAPAQHPQFPDGGEAPKGHADDACGAAQRQGNNQQIAGNAEKRT